ISRHATSRIDKTNNTIEFLLWHKWPILKGHLHPAARPSVCSKRGSRLRLSARQCRSRYQNNHERYGSSYPSFVSREREDCELQILGQSMLFLSLLRLFQSGSLSQLSVSCDRS